MKFILKIEDLLNALLIKLGKLFLFLFNKLCPFACKEKIDRKLKKIEEYRKKSEEKLKIQGQKVQAKTVQFIHKVKEAKLQEKAVQKIDSTITTFKEVKVKTIPSSISQFIHKLEAKISNWAKKQNPKVVTGITLLLIVASFIGINIFLYTQKIAQKISREHADETTYSDELIQRPTYYKRNKKYFDLNGVNLPVYVMGRATLKALMVDITIESSNRFIPKYFAKFEHEVRDYLNSTLEPVVPHFPVESEGKRILRKKIKDELNNFLKVKKIRGKILHIHIQAIIAN